MTVKINKIIDEINDMNRKLTFDARRKAAAILDLGDTGRHGIPKQYYDMSVKGPAKLNVDKMHPMFAFTVACVRYLATCDVIDGEDTYGITPAIRDVLPYFQMIEDYPDEWIQEQSNGKIDLVYVESYLNGDLTWRDAYTQYADLERDVLTVLDIFRERFANIEIFFDDDNSKVNVKTFPNL